MRKRSRLDRLDFLAAKAKAVEAAAEIGYSKPLHDTLRVLRRPRRAPRVFVVDPNGEQAGTALADAKLKRNTFKL